MRGSFFAGSPSSPGKTRQPGAVGLGVDTSLIIKVDQINEPRQAFLRPLTRGFLTETFAGESQWSPRAPSEVDARLTKVNARNVLLEGTTHVSLTSPCRRCLRDVESEQPVSFTLSLVHREEKKGAHARRDAEDDGEGSVSSSFDDGADEERFDGERIDLAPLVREQILLALPATEPLCTEGCLGLCATCGQNLNDADCGHSRTPPDPRWNALKNVKLTN